MRDDWKEPDVQKAEPKAPVIKTGSEPPAQAAADEFEQLLAEYETRKQRDAQRLVEKALDVENARRKGVEVLRKHAIGHTRDTVRRLQQAGHKVVYHESLDAYPPNLRLHLYPKAGPVDLETPSRRTFELVWGEPDPDRLFARRWTSTGLGEMIELGSVSGAELDELWVREQLLGFVRSSLSLS